MYFNVKIGLLVFLVVWCDALRLDRDIFHPKTDYPGTESRQEEKNPNFWRAKAKEQLKAHLARQPNTNDAKNIIMFLGDGMSIPTLTASRLLLGGENKQLSFETFPYTGLSKPYCVNGQTADSACSATAYLCGVKANEGTVGVSANVTQKDCDAMLYKKNQVSSISKWAQDAGKATGIITTTRITHASPCANYAHIADRDWESDTDVLKDSLNSTKCHDVAYQLIHQEPGKNFKVLLGGGRGKFLPKELKDEENDYGDRSDGRNLIQDWKNDRSRKGKAEYVWNKRQLEAIDPAKTEYLLGLFENDHCKYHLDVLEEHSENEEPSLSDMVSKAIDVLSKDANGFFLFVEGGRIDHAHHDTKPRKALDETVELSKAVSVALNKTCEKDTLIVVTSDHAHTMSMSGFPPRGNDIFGVAKPKVDDNLPIATLTYANGPGYYTHINKFGGRKDYTLAVNTQDKDYLAPSLAPLGEETHGADDVAVFAKGPWSHLFTGNYEQNLIPHMMAYAANIGRNEL